VGDLRRLSRAWLVVAGVVLMLGMGGAVAAPAYADGPVWTISSSSSPTNFVRGDETGDDTYVLTVVDAGSESAGGTQVEVSDSLPSGLVASAISGEDVGNGQTLSCSLTPTLGCSYDGFEMAPGDVLRIDIRVKVGSGVGSSVVNSATVTGGGADAGASTRDATTISSAPAGFGISDFAAAWSGTQAGAPVNLTAGFTLNQVVENGEYQPAALPKDVEVKLPPGVLADTTTMPHCPPTGGCEKQAAVGVVFASLSSTVGGPPTPYSSLIYNLAPEPGELAAFAFELAGKWVRVQGSVSPENDYRTSLHVENISQIAGLLSMEMTLWGVPGAYNDPLAGPDRVLSEPERGFGPSGGGAIPFLIDGSACEAPGAASVLSVDSWANEGVFSEASSSIPALTGCNRLPFDPSLTVTPDINEADTPSGYEMDLTIPQPNEAGALASANLENAAVTLPEGAGISLSAADGLQACTEAQVALNSSAPSTCPDASKIGTVEVETSLLANPLQAATHSLQGAIYMAKPSENPLASPLAMYIVAEESQAGVRLKLAGQIEANPLTGQLTIVFRELPQLSISALDLRFFGGERSLLSTPPACGMAVATSELTPWSATAPAAPSSAFEIDSGIDGTSCSEPQPFSPSFRAESASAGETGAYDSLALFVSRTHQEQELSTIAIQAPAAVAQIFAGAQPCGEPQASVGGCTKASEVGVVAAKAGLGIYAPDLYGRIYLTGPYDGSAEGLSIVLPIDPAPLELGRVVVRASVAINPGTGRLDIASARLPSFAEGARLSLDELLLQFERGELKIDPTGCESLAVTGTITSTQGSSVSVSAEPLGAPSSPCSSVQAPSSETNGVSSVVSPNTTTVSLLATRLTTNARGLMTVKLTCAGAGACYGKLTLLGKAKNRDKSKRSKTTTIGTGSFSIPAGATATVKLALNARGRALLKAGHGRLSATLTISSPTPNQTHSEGVRLVRGKRD
jgi:hypothetical protein